MMLVSALSTRFKATDARAFFGFTTYLLCGLLFVIALHAVNYTSMAWFLLLPFLLTLSHRGISKQGLLVCAGLFLASPTYIAAQRNSMNDIIALFFSLLYIYATQRYIRQPVKLRLLIATCCGLIAALLKIEAFFAFHLLVGFLLVEDFCKNAQPASAASPWRIFGFLAFIVLPLLIASYLGSWEFGSWKDHVSPYIWTPILNREFNAAVGLENFVLYSFLALLLFARKHLLAFIIALFLFVVPLFLFTSKHFAFASSAFDNGIFCIVAVGLAINGLLEHPQRWLRGLGLALFFLTSFSAIVRFKLL
jgi:hypothetical protein